MPCVTLDCRPSGLPIAKTMSPVHGGRMAECRRFRRRAAQPDDGEVIGRVAPYDRRLLAPAAGHGHEQPLRRARDMGVGDDVTFPVVHDA